MRRDTTRAKAATRPADSSRDSGSIEWVSTSPSDFITRTTWFEVRAGEAGRHAEDSGTGCSAVIWRGAAARHHHQAQSAAGRVDACALPRPRGVPTSTCSRLRRPIRRIAGATKASVRTPTTRPLLAAEARRRTWNRGPNSRMIRRPATRAGRGAARSHPHRRVAPPRERVVDVRIQLSNRERETRWNFG